MALVRGRRMGSGPSFANRRRFGYPCAVKKMFISFLILVVAIALVLVGCKATRAGYESAPYKVVRADGKFEVRDYPALRVVETPMSGGGSGSDGSFNRLFRFHHRRERGEAKDCHDDSGVYVRWRLESRRWRLCCPRI